MPMPCAPHHSRIPERVQYPKQHPVPRSRSSPQIPGKHSSTVCLYSGHFTRIKSYSLQPCPAAWLQGASSTLGHVSVVGFFSWLNNIPSHGWATFGLAVIRGETLGLLPLCVYVTGADVSCGGHVVMGICVFRSRGHLPGSGTAGSCRDPRFACLGNRQPVSAAAEAFSSTPCSE